MIDRLRRQLAARTDISRHAAQRRQGRSPLVPRDLIWRSAQRPDDRPDELDRLITG